MEPLKDLLHDLEVVTRLAKIHGQWRTDPQHFASQRAEEMYRIPTLVTQVTRFNTQIGDLFCRVTADTLTFNTPNTPFTTDIHNDARLLQLLQAFLNHLSKLKTLLQNRSIFKLVQRSDNGS